MLYVSGVLGKAVEKLAFLEKRLEELVQTGDESARHLVTIVMEYDMKCAKGSLRWALRRTLEAYTTWRSAKVRLNMSCSKEVWSLVVESAKIWVKDEVENLRMYP